MNILIVSATHFEVAPLSDWLSRKATSADAGSYQITDGLRVRLLVTGVGIPLTMLHLTETLSSQTFDLAINAGVAGSFRQDLPLGEVVQVSIEQFADLGVEEADGSFTDVFEMGLIDPNAPPFHAGVLVNPAREDLTFLPSVTGLTINKVHGYPPSIDQIMHKYPSDVESMEGAAFFLCCLHRRVQFMEIRAISNYVEARNRENWDLGLAIANLNKVLVELLSAIH